MSTTPFEDVVELNKEGSESGEDLTLNAFPIHALNPVMRVIAEETAKVHQVPIEMAAMTTIATISGALGKAFTLAGAVNGKESFGNLYTIIAAPKSTGKGATSSIVQPLIIASDEMAKAFQEGKLGKLLAEEKILKEEERAILKQFYTKKGEKGKPLTDENKEELQEHLIEIHQKLEIIKPQIVSPPTYWIQNATSEAMAAQFACNNDALFCFSAEAGEVVRVLLGKYQTQSKGDFDLFLSGYSVEEWRTDRIQRGVVRITPCLSTLLFCQPCVLRELISNEEAFERGLTARALLILVEPEIKEDDGIIRAICPQAQEAWEKLIRDILHLRSLEEKIPHQIVCSPEAREVFRVFHNESVKLRNGKFRDIEGELGRWRENAIRIALGLCVADRSNLILTEEHAKQAVEIARWCAHSGLSIFQSSRVKKMAKRVERLLEIIKGTQERVTLRDLGLRHSFFQKEVEHLAAEFPDKFSIITYKPPTGRSSTIVVIPEFKERVS